MTEYQKMGEKNAAIRGYIMRLLIKGARHCMPARRISNMLQRDGYTEDADISTHLAFLHELEFIQFTRSNISPYNAYSMDGVVSLTTKGIRFIERGGNPDVGIDL